MVLVSKLVMRCPAPHYFAKVQRTDGALLVVTRGARGRVTTENVLFVADAVRSIGLLCCLLTIVARLLSTLTIWIITEHWLGLLVRIVFKFFPSR